MIASTDLRAARHWYTRLVRHLGCLLGCIFALVALGCGGGGGGSASVQPGPLPNQPPDPPIISGTSLPPDVHWQPPEGATPAQGNYVYLQSDAGERIGGGGTYRYTEADSSFGVGYLFSVHNIDIGHVERQWSGSFVLSDLVPGFHGNAGNVGAVSPAMRWVSEGRECASVQAWMVVDSISGADAIEMRFMHRCAGASAVLRGKIRWRASEARQGPIAAIPAGLWRPPASANLPTSGSHVYLESAGGDYVGRGETRLFTPRNAALDLLFTDSFSGQFYTILAQAGTETWAGNFIGIRETKLRPGYYPGVQRFPFARSGIGAMEWARDGRGCGRVIGWFTVDDVVYVGDSILHLEMRFEQRCDLSRATLRGKVLLSAFDLVPPPGPLVPAPPALWTPPAGATPPSGDYVYLQSDTGDSVGGGQTRLYVPANATLRATPYTDSFHVRIDGDSTWVGSFQTMNSLQTLQPGYYRDLQWMPGHDAALGGLAWARNGVGCTSAAGWVVIDSLSLASNGSVAELEMRFEQHCAGDPGVLRGKLRWSAPARAAENVIPVPAGLWQPPSGATPAVGNFVYLESDYGDALGQGDVRLYTTENALLSAFASDPVNFGPAYVRAESSAGIDVFDATFYAPFSLGDALGVGFYGNLRGSALSAEVGAIQSGWRSLSCAINQSGWFAVDSIAYSSPGVLSTFEARFEQTCDESFGSLRGKIRWAASDTSLPPGPKPVPANLWRPAAGATPSSGTFLYLESEYGDDVGDGKVVLFTSDTNLIQGHGFANLPTAFDLEVNDLASVERWSAQFQTMAGQNSLQVGLYDDVGRHPFNNATRGGMMVLRSQSFCNSISGWYVVDSVSYVGGEVSAIEIRFEQHCEKRSASLRGKLRWLRP